ncbi:MAG: TetR/AcrR family transcriptional regulator [Planctomycetota bacterium]|jgi:AcrR family transcriptional regulator
MSATATQTTILDAAEALFAETGFAATSLRELTAKAGANLAAVSYHFGSKEGLAIAVLKRRMDPINAERRARLDALPAHPSVEAIVRAFVEPLLRPGVVHDAAPVQPGSGFCRLVGRLMVEQPPFLRDFLAAQFRDLGWRFCDALRQALPGHDAATLWWRLHFLVGAIAHTLQNAATLRHLTDGLCGDDDVDAVVEQLVQFAAAGMQAKAPAQQAARQPQETTGR